MDDEDTLKVYGNVDHFFHSLCDSVDTTKGSFHLSFSENFNGI